MPHDSLKAVYERAEKCRGILAGLADGLAAWPAPGHDDLSPQVLAMLGATIAALFEITEPRDDLQTNDKLGIPEDAARLLACVNPLSTNPLDMPGLSTHQAILETARETLFAIFSDAIHGISGETDGWWKFDGTRLCWEDVEKLTKRLHLDFRKLNRAGPALRAEFDRAAERLIVAPSRSLDGSQDTGYLSAVDISRKYSMPLPALANRLKRWKEVREKTESGGYTESANPKRREPRFLYQVSACWGQIRDLAATTR